MGWLGRALLGLLKSIMVAKGWESRAVPTAGCGPWAKRGRWGWQPVGLSLGQGNAPVRSPDTDTAQAPCCAKSHSMDLQVFQQCCSASLQEPGRAGGIARAEARGGLFVYKHQLDPPKSQQLLQGSARVGRRPVVRAGAVGWQRCSVMLFPALLLGNSV